MTRRLIVIALFCVAALVGPAPRAAHALPHGCISVSNDHWAEADLFRRDFGVAVFRDQPCTFGYMPGDRYSGTGRFSIRCASGGYYFHPDYTDGELREDINKPIPQPCRRGDTVTIDGFHTGTGGAVAAGGAGDLAKPNIAMDSGEFGSLCDNASEAKATVSLLEPVNYNGLLTFGGAVDCRGASIAITRVTITGLGGWPAPAYAGTTDCHQCRSAIAVASTVPARWTEWDVEMRFTVSRPGHAPVDGYRIGRYATTWGGHVSNIYPNTGDDLL